ncbi:unnamed protein product, partial [Laminaria digitata]
MCCTRTAVTIPFIFLLYAPPSPLLAHMIPGTGVFFRRKKVVFSFEKSCLPANKVIFPSEKSCFFPVKKKKVTVSRRGVPGGFEACDLPFHSILGVVVWIGVVWCTGNHYLRIYPRCGRVRDLR